MAFAAGLPLVRDQRLLDVQCGTGNVSIAAARAGGDVTGVDQHEPFLSRGRAWAKNEGLLVRFKPAAPEKLPFSDGNFHAVVNYQGLPKTDRPEAAAAEMRRVCRQRGLLAVTAWDSDGFMGDVLRLLFGYTGDERLARALSLSQPDALEALFAVDERPRRTARRETTLRFPLPPDEVASCYLEFDPLLRDAVSALDRDARQELEHEFAQLWRHGTADLPDGVCLSTAYHELVLDGS